MPGRIFLKRGKHKPLANHHPWIFSGAIDRVEDSANGQTVDVFDAGSNWLARASYSANSQIAARVWTFERHEGVDQDFFERRLKASIERRDAALVGSAASNPLGAYRLVNAESDGLPGLIVDRYADYLVAQFLTAGAEAHKTEIVSILAQTVRPRTIYERSDVDVRKKEGLPQVNGCLFGEEPPELVEIEENGLRFWVNVRRGHKTGFYLDQRVNRLRAAPYLRGDVLNVFSYTGGFGINAAYAGASKVTNMDASAGSLDLAKKNFESNGLDGKAEFITADALHKLRTFRDHEIRFDGIVLDPPKFVSSNAQMERGLRGYKDINLLAFELLRPGGVLVTFSCSGLVSADLFQKVVFGASLDARRSGQIVEKLSQAPDHPISLTFPEAEYLKGLVIQVQ